MVIVWRKLAVNQLEAACNYIGQESVQNAAKVKRAITDFIEELASHPETRPLDRNKRNNDGTFRYFEMHRLRVSYRVLNNGIFITTVRHTRRKPRHY
jgi:plasmid stabilization system protein ParE